MKFVLFTALMLLLIGGPFAVVAGVKLVLTLVLPHDENGV